jgi:dihydrofolate synthase/folylpolyglutamate synthase
LTVESRYRRYLEIVEDSGEALARARSLAGRDDLICVAGSLYLVGEIKRSEADRAAARRETK